MRHPCIVLSVGLLSLLLYSPLAGQGRVYLSAVQGGRDSLNLARARQSDTVRLVVTDVNPFLFQTRLKVNEFAVSEPALAAFAAWIVPKMPKPDSASLRSTVVAPQLTARGAIACSPEDRRRIKAEIEAYRPPLQRLLEIRTGLLNRVAGVQESEEAFERTRARERGTLMNPLATTGELRAAVGILAPATKGLLEAAETLGTDLSHVLAAQARLQVELVSAQAAAGNCSELYNLVIAEAKRLSLSEDRAAKLQANVDTILDGYPIWAELHSLASDSSSFTIQRLIGPYDHYTEVLVNVERRAAGSQRANSDTVWRTVRGHRILFGGGQRFSLGVGLVADWNSRGESFIAVKRYRDPPSSGADSVLTTIERSSEPSTGIAPMLLLGVRALGPSRTIIPGLSLQLLLGAGPREDADKLRIDYFGGAGVGIWDDRLIASLGWYSRSESTGLAGGFSVGDSIPNGQSVPVLTERNLRFAGLLGFRVF